MVTKRANGEGSIRKKIVKGKIYYEGRYTDAKGQQKSVSAKTQSEVRDKLKKAQTKVDKERKEQEAKKNGQIYYDENMTLNEWYEIYMKTFTDGLKLQTITRYESYYKVAFQETLGHIKLQNITEEVILDVIKDLRQRHAAESTINTYMIILRKLFIKAVDKKIIHDNVLKKIKFKEAKTKKPKRELTTDEISLLLEVVARKRRYLCPFFVFLLHTGCRVSEAISLKWQDISDDFKFCNINKTRAEYKDIEKNKYVYYDSTPKNDTSNRTIPLDTEVQNMLQELVETRKQQGKYTKESNVFLSKQLKILHANYIDVLLKTFSETMQKEYNPNFPMISSHWFRHTFTSRGIEKNVPLFYLQKIGGWKNLQMISKVYGHMNEEQALNAVNSIYGN